MTSSIAKYLAAASLCGLAGSASAGTIPIDIFTVAGVPDSGGYTTTVQGPCYCDQTAWISPVVVLAPGTYDFGTLRDFWVQSGYTPDGGPDQPNLYVLFGPVEAVGLYPYDFPAPVTYAYPSTALCAQTDDACNASYPGTYADTDLIVTVAPGENAVQLAFIGSYLYMSPLPEPLTLAMFVLGLALVAGVSRKRGPSDA